jgi:hypothetical protein
MAVKAVLILVLLWVAAESLGAICHMHGIKQFCHSMKYYFTCITSVLLIYALFNNHPLVKELWLVVLVTLSFAFWVWPRMVWRFRTFMTALELFEDEAGWKSR